MHVAIYIYLSPAWAGTGIGPVGGLGLKNLGPCRASIYIYTCIYLHLLWHHNYSRVFAAINTSFHSSQFCTFSSQFDIPNFPKSCFIPFIHRFFERPLGPFPMSLHSSAALRYSESDLLITCPNYAFTKLVILRPSVNSHILVHR